MSWTWASGVDFRPREHCSSPNPQMPLGAGGAGPGGGRGRRGGRVFRVKPSLCMETEVEVGIPLKVASQTLFSMGFLSITKLSKAIPFTQVKFLSGGFPFPVSCLRRLRQGPAQSHAEEERKHATVGHSDTLPHSAQRGDQPPIASLSWTQTRGLVSFRRQE